MIRKLQAGDRDKILRILSDTGNFNDEEIKIALELIDVYLNNKDQKDYEIYVDENENDILGYVCFGPRPLTVGTYDLYWIAVNPVIQSKGIGSALMKFVETNLKKNNARLLLIETSGKSSYEKERKFYHKNEYSVFSEIKDFYNKGDSLVIFGKYL
ncbi:MAG: hypothetical protein HGGPFJEG_01530 [Ignavibacteria bacterium]|nr:hypothetical protein [Ignavibacteria bacterium]